MLERVKKTMGRRALAPAAIPLILLSGPVTRAGPGEGWTFGPRDECELTADADERGNVPIHAICEWAIPPARFHALLGRWAGYDEIFRNVGQSEVVGHVGGLDLVRQVHVARGIEEREVYVLYESHPVEGGMRYTWRKADDQSAVAPGRVEVAIHDGYWEVVTLPGGSRVEYLARYHPGGRIPFFLVRWFQAAGVHGVLEDLRRAAEGDAAR